MKLKQEYDIVIIGSGLGGLVAGNIFAKEGYSVCILEKNNQYGGNLQTFVREKTIFDTGVHYIGGLEEGQNMYQYFKYLDIIDDLKLKKLDKDGFDVITFGENDKEYRHAQGIDNFKATLLEEFPQEETAISEYCTKLQDTTSKFPLYCMKVGKPEYDDFNLFEESAKSYIDSITDNNTLKAVLAGTNLLYAGQGDKTPFYVHALSVDSYIKSAYRCLNGGSQISKFLIKRLFENGGHAFKHQEVTEITCEGKTAVSVKTNQGHIIKGKTFISNIEPKLTLDILKTDALRKSYIKRIKNIKSTIAAFSLHVVLKPNTFRYKNYNVYHYKSEDSVWSSQNYTNESWPESYMISMGPKTNNDIWADNFTALAYMNYDEVKPWEDTFNTVSHKNNRGQTYKEFKEEKTEQFIKELEKKFPDIRACIETVYTSTPLSYRDYIGSNRGSMYGYEKDVNFPLHSNVSARTKIENLFFTGQSTNMHGILGVTISGVLTCGEILGTEYLMKKVWESN